MQTLRILLIPILTLPMVACTWVKLDDSGVGVALINPELATSCERIGTTRSRSKATIGSIARDEETVAMELLNLAKNSAAQMGGDALTEAGPMADGQQAFIVYRCQKRVF